MTDPADIDLEKVKGCCSDIPNLIAAVEALRSRNAVLQRVADAKPEKLNQELLDENEALRERMTALGEDNARRIRRVEAAEARVAKLAEALEQAALELDEASNLLRGSGLPTMAGIYARAARAAHTARTALAAMPTKEPAP